MINQPKNRVLVTDAQTRNSLAIIRSLGSRNLEVAGGEVTHFATGFFSKYCRRQVVYPDPARYPEKFTDYLLDVVKDGGYQAIFPVTDATVIPIIRDRERFKRYTLVPPPTYEILMKAVDKAQTVRIAQENSIACPETWLVEEIGIEKVKSSFRFPVLIKPRRSFGSRGLALCHSPDELVAMYPQVIAVYGPCLIQEYIPPGGEALGVYLLLNDASELRALTVQRRLRSYPESGGPSTLRETVKAPQLVETALRLLRAMKWSGIAMVEFRIDPRDNQPKLMEVNPRWWGSLQLSILAGVDFPYLLYRMLTEGDIEPVINYQVGVRCRWLLPGDILWFLSNRHKWHNLPGFFRFEKNDDIISWRDPGPTFGFCLACLRYLIDRDMHKFVIRKSV